MILVKSFTNSVAPFAGAWIEIILDKLGLGWNNVAPFAGAWIEMNIKKEPMISRLCRSLRGSVD